MSLFPERHGAIEPSYMGGARRLVLVEHVKKDAESAQISAKMKALLAIAGHVQQNGKHVTARTSPERGARVRPSRKFPT